MLQVLAARPVFEPEIRGVVGTGFRARVAAKQQILFDAVCQRGHGSLPPPNTFQITSCGRSKGEIALASAMANPPKLMNFSFVRPLQVLALAIFAPASTCSAQNRARAIGDIVLQRDRHRNQAFAQRGASDDSHRWRGDFRRRCRAVGAGRERRWRFAAEIDDAPAFAFAQGARAHSGFR